LVAILGVTDILQYYRMFSAHSVY